MNASHRQRAERRWEIKDGDWSIVEWFVVNKAEIADENSCTRTDYLVCFKSVN